MNQDFQIRHGSKHYRPCNQYKHHFHRSHHRSLLDGQSVKDILLSKYLDTYMKSLSLKKINFGHQVPKSFAPNYLERSYFVFN